MVFIAFVYLFVHSRIGAGWNDAGSTANAKDARTKSNCIDIESIAAARWHANATNVGTTAATTTAAEAGATDSWSATIHSNRSVCVFHAVLFKHLTRTDFI